MAMIPQYETNLIYRKLDENGDSLFGHGAEDFLTGVEAITQAILTRLRAIRAARWEGGPSALPGMTEILGAPATGRDREMIDLMVIDRIMDTVGVLSVRDVASEIRGRAYTFSCVADTVYGSAAIEFTV